MIIEYDVVIIGAGQCGTLLAYYLDKKNISYVVLEKDRAFSSWYKRWDSFYMNTANWMNILPGKSLLYENDNSRSSKVQIITYFEQWLNSFSINFKISCIKKVKLDNLKFIVDTDNDTYQAKLVVFAIGLNKSKLPELQKKLPGNIFQLHSSEYRNLDQIKTSNILIVGTGSSGVQICKDLAKTNNYSITLSCSKNKYFQWEVLGISIYSYVKRFNLFSIKSNSLLGRFVMSLSRDKGDPATPPSPENLQLQYGVVLKGRLIDINNNRAVFENNEELNLEDTTIIWCTGYQVDISSLVDQNLKGVLIDHNGNPKLQSEFQSSISNMYCIGLRFQRLVSSHIIYGAVRDSKKLASEIIRKFKNKII